MNEPVRWGVIGATARIAGGAFIPALCESVTGTLVAVASRSLESAQAVASTCGTEGVAAYGDYDSLIADARVEALYIPLPNNLHLGWAVEAMNNGKHVLCEKPLAMSASEAAEMADTAGDNGVLLSEAFMYRYHPLQKEIFELIRHGTIGTVSNVRTSFTFVQVSTEDYRRDPSMGGGALLDVGCYCVHIARQAFGREPVSAHGEWVIDSASGIDTRTTAQLDFGMAGTAELACAFGDEFQASYVITGDRGTVSLTKFFGEGRVDDASYTLSLSGEEPKVMRSPPSNMYTGEIDAMSRHIRGEDLFLLTAQDAVDNMRTLDAIAASARSGASTLLT